MPKSQHDQKSHAYQPLSQPPKKRYDDEVFQSTLFSELLALFAFLLLKARPVFGFLSMIGAPIYNVIEKVAPPVALLSIGIRSLWTLGSTYFNETAKQRKTRYGSAIATLALSIGGLLLAFGVIAAPVFVLPILFTAIVGMGLYSEYATNKQIERDQQHEILSLRTQLSLSIQKKLRENPKLTKQNILDDWDVHAAAIEIAKKERKLEHHKEFSLGKITNHTFSLVGVGLFLSSFFVIPFVGQALAFVGITLLCVGGIRHAYTKYQEKKALKLLEETTPVNMSNNFLDHKARKVITSALSTARDVIAKKNKDNPTTNKTPVVEEEQEKKKEKEEKEKQQEKEESVTSVRPQSLSSSNSNSNNESNEPTGQRSVTIIRTRGNSLPSILPSNNKATDGDKKRLVIAPRKDFMPDVYITDKKDTVEKSRQKLIKTRTNSWVTAPATIVQQQEQSGKVGTILSLKSFGTFKSKELQPQTPIPTDDKRQNPAKSLSGRRMSV